MLMGCISGKCFIKNYLSIISATLRLAEEKTTLLKQCEESVSLKAEETEQLRLRLEEAQQELLLANNQVWTQQSVICLFVPGTATKLNKKALALCFYPYCTVDVAHIVMHNAIYPPI